jgi:hypothetical protein
MIFLIIYYTFLGLTILISQKIEISLDKKLKILGIANKYDSVIKSIFLIDKATIKNYILTYIFDSEDVMSFLKKLRFTSVMFVKHNVIIDL